MKLISSPDNPQYKFWKMLTASKGLKESGYFILSGEKLIHECLSLNQFEIRAEIVTKGLNSIQTQAPCFMLPENLFKNLDILGTDTNLLIVKIPPIIDDPNLNAQTSPAQSERFIQVIAPLGDPRNMGSLIRSSVAFGAQQIILTKESCHPFLPQSVKAASLACLHIDFLQGPSLESLDGECLTLDSQGTPLTDFKFPKNFKILVGQEGLGLKKLNKKMKVTPLSIPTQTVESLNASVALSILLYEAHRQHRLQNKVI